MNWADRPAPRPFTTRAVVITALPALIKKTVRAHQARADEAHDWIAVAHAMSSGAEQVDVVRVTQQCDGPWIGSTELQLDQNVLRILLLADSRVRVESKNDLHYDPRSCEIALRLLSLSMRTSAR